MEALWLLAQAICDQVESFQPNLVIVLLRSGEGPLRAALALWDETRGVPFPPVVRTNLGREKVRRYHELRDSLGREPLIEWVHGPDEAAHLLAWVAEQRPWQAELAAQVHAVLGDSNTPARILVVDDFAFEGTTWLLALGLLKEIFPQAEARYIAGTLGGWSGNLARYWLQEHYPDVRARMEAEAQSDRQQGQLETCLIHLRWIATGTEEVDPESLDWRPLSTNSETVQKLTRFLPAETWLALPAWVYATIETHVRRRAQKSFSASARAGSLFWGKLPFVRGRSKEPPGTASTSPTTRRHATLERLTPAHLVLRHAWRTRHVTRRDVEAICGMNPSQATRVLEDLVEQGYLVCQGRGNSTWYDLRPRLGILAYGSLLTDPGPEIEAATDHRIEQVETPFEVEYARSSKGRAGAPTLVLVPEGKGARVQAQVLVMRPDMGMPAVQDMLYRRETNRVGDERVTYESYAQPKKSDPVLIEEVSDLAGVPCVLYTRLKPNLDFVLQDDLPAEVKAKRLAQLAVDSVTPETFRENRDGIRYLADAIRHGVRTPLTAPYREAILRLAGDAPDLEVARRHIARRKGIPVEEQP
ncbi:MAG: hypothetical protein D6791_10025 [Chloroflexi bacterium]|nr:MAG: hypothetical protein D6791_10025 [Chloroflexota bacterium]